MPRNYAMTSSMAECICVTNAEERTSGDALTGCAWKSVKG